jgi:hypothetical protein
MLPAGVSTLIVTGGRDPVAPASPLMALEGEGLCVSVVEEADHGWWPGVDGLTGLAREFVGNLLAEQ